VRQSFARCRGNELWLPPASNIETEQRWVVQHDLRPSASVKNQTAVFVNRGLIRFPMLSLSKCLLIMIRCGFWPSELRKLLKHNPCYCCEPKPGWLSYSCFMQEGRFSGEVYSWRGLVGWKTLLQTSKTVAFCSLDVTYEETPPAVLEVLEFIMPKEGFEKLNALAIKQGW